MEISWQNLAKKRHFFIWFIFCRSLEAKKASSTIISNMKTSSLGLEFGPLLLKATGEVIKIGSSWKSNHNKQISLVLTHLEVLIVEFNGNALKKV